MIFFDKNKTISPSIYDLQKTFSPEEAGSNAWENFKAAKENMRSTGVWDSRGRVLKDAWQPYIDRINDAFKENGIEYIPGEKFIEDRGLLEVGQDLFSGRDVPNPAKSYTGVTGGAINDNIYNSHSNEVIRIIKEYPDLFPDLQELTQEQVTKDAYSQAINDHLKYLKISENSPGWSKAAARFLGEMTAVSTDPVVLTSMLVSAGSSKILQLMFTEAAIAGGSEVLIQTSVMDWYEELGLDYTFEQFITAVGSAATFGAALPGAIYVGGKAINLTADQWKKGVDALFANKKLTKPSLVKTGEHILEQHKHLNETNPLENSNNPAMQVEHEKNMLDAHFALENQEVPTIHEKPASKLSASAYEKHMNKANVDVLNLKPDQIKVDAKTYQFKSDVDAEGVSISEGLKDIKKWDPVFAGQLLVHERLDGTFFVADGHQRLGLAKRLTAEDPSQNIVLPSIILREADGITPDMAYTKASLKNIAQLNTRSRQYLDAAKVLRNADPRFKDFLPPKSDIVKVGQDIARLKDEPWDLAMNDFIPDKQAGIVGRIIPDDEKLQLAAMHVLKKTKPDNLFEAEAIVNQVKNTDVMVTKQETLFGDEFITESLIAERAKILNNARKQIQKDKSTFNNLVQNSTRLEQVGNKLAKEANETKVLDDSMALAMLQAQADKKGLISDALTENARLAKETGSYNQATSNFLQALRRGITEGDFRGGEPSDIRQPIYGEDKSHALSPEPKLQDQNLEEFSEPFGKGAKDQADQLEKDLFGEDRIIDTRTLGVEEAEKLRRNLHLNQGINSIDELMQKQTKNHADLTKNLSEISKEMGITVKAAPLKNRARIEEKANQKYAGELNLIGDVARGGVEVPTPKQANEFIKRFSQKYKVVDEGYVTTDLGYFDRKLTVVFDDGLIGEVQIWSPGMADAKFAKGDALYQKYRDDKIPITERRRAKKESKILYNAVLNKLDKSWLDEININQKGVFAPISVTDDLKSSADISGDLASLKTSVGEMGAYSRVEGESKNILPGSGEYAGSIPSTRKNLIVDTSTTNISPDDPLIKGIDEEQAILFEDVTSGGSETFREQTLKDLKKELDKDAELLKRLDFCSV